MSQSRRLRSFTIPCLLLAAAVLCLAAAPRRPRVAIVGGFPAPDVPVYEFVFRKFGAKPITFEKKWLSVDEYADYSAVVMNGSLLRPKVEPTAFADADIPKLRQYLEGGGTLILAGTTEAFRLPAGRTFFDGLTGRTAPRDKDKGASKVLQADHPWVKPLAGQDLAWLDEHAVPIVAGNGQRLIGSDDRAILARFPLGKGQVIYIGWDVTHFIPHGRDLRSTMEQDRRYEAQYQVVENLVKDLLPPRK